ncbi:hypothetical protein [Haloarchaeobius amylolyticus]|uniref:hypothetical protein n=1 Tax=Haloarchaeobius amylolyticus TaxID=1198296 RepID=UPI00226F7E1E|nr:hypothetical protein [Haloarchaeobius amylolyticus]
MPQDDTSITRRRLLAGGAAAAAFGLAGCLGGDSQVEPERPNDDGEGSLGELRWILEEQYSMQVTSMTFGDGRVDLTYQSQATSRGESREEIGAVISAYGLIVAHDGPSEVLRATIEDRFAEQATSYQIQASWVKRWRNGDMSDSLVAQRVFNTRTFPKSASQ